MRAPTNRSQKPEARRQGLFSWHPVFWLLTIVSGPFWLLTSDIDP
jgi:hypothetical protein